MRDFARRRTRVAIVGHHVGRAVFGAERSLLGILAALDAERYDVSCVFPSGDGDYLRTVARYTKRITVFPYRWWSGTEPVDEAAVSRFQRVFLRDGVELVHVNTITLLDPLVAARRLGIPCAVHARELIDRDGGLAHLLDEDPEAIVDTILGAADFVIANSDETHRLFTKEGRSYRLYNSVDVDAFDLPNERERGRLRVGIISSNEPNKGIDRFVELAVLARAERPDLEFVVIGPRNAHVARLEAEIGELGFPVRLTFEGYVPDPVEAIRRVDVVVSLSTVPESFGRTIAEAMAARRPVVAWSRGAAPELVRHGTDGFLVPFRDVSRVLEHLATLADDPGRVAAMGKSARERCVRLFGPKVFAPQLDAIYREILKTRSVSSP